MMGFIGLAFLESTVEEDQGGGEGTRGWRKNIFGYELKEFHFWLWYIVVPIFVFSPVIALGPDLRLFGRPWSKIGRLEIPQFYLRNAIAAAIVWALFIWY